MRGVVALVVAVLGGAAAAQPAPTPTPTDPVPVQPPVEQPPAPPPATPAEQAFNEGRALMDEGKPGEACAKFEASIKLDPEAAGTLLNLGLCNERLGRTATALYWFRKAQFRASEAGMTDYEDVAKNHTFELAVRVPTLKITFANPPPPGSVVYVDDKQVSELELAKLEVDPTYHRVELRMQGKPPVRAEITVKDGDNKVVELAVPPPVKVIDLIDHGVGQRRVAYIVGGAGVALWGASFVVSLVAQDRHDKSDDPDERFRQKNIARWGGTSLFVAGTAAIVGATYLYLAAPGVERRERTIVAPVLGTDHVGLVVNGGF